MFAAHTVGKEGEDEAVRYLTDVGYRILERNVRLGRYEIDIVAEDRKRKMIVFVEVKTRAAHDPRYPLRTAVDRRKRRALLKASARWVTKHQYVGPGRTDIIGIAAGRVQEHIMNLGGNVWDAW